MSPRSPPDCHKRSLLGMSVNMPELWWQGQPIPCVGLQFRAACALVSFQWALQTHGYTPDTGALLGTLLCEDFCLFCTTPFTDVLGVLIEYKRINKSLALRSRCSTFKESNHTASTVLNTNKLENNLSLMHAH